jgi:hypothetical protein
VVELTPHDLRPVAVDLELAIAAKLELGLPQDVLRARHDGEHVTPPGQLRLVDGPMLGDGTLLRVVQK